MPHLEVDDLVELLSKLLAFDVVIAPSKREGACITSLNCCPDVVAYQFVLHHLENMQKGNRPGHARCGGTSCLLQIVQLVHV